MSCFCVCMCACKTETVKEWAFWMSVQCRDYYCNSVSMFCCMIHEGSRIYLMLFFVLLKETVWTSVSNECVVLRLFLLTLFFVLWKCTWLVVLWQNWNSIENLFDICIVEVGRAKHKCWHCWLCGDRMEMVRNVWHYYLYCRSRPHQTLILTWPFVCWQNGNGEKYLTLFFESLK